MAEDFRFQVASTTLSGNNSPAIPTNSEPILNYVWDDKLCKTALKQFKMTVFTPPILSLPDAKDKRGHYVCAVEGCGKAFNFMSQFRLHLKRHLPECEKPFKCDQPTCTRTFARYDELKCHKRTHTGEKPYGCEQCFKRFAQNHHLNKHLRVHIKEAKIKMSSEDVSCDDRSDAAIDSLKNAKSLSKPTEKLHKCSVEGCERAFRVPYELKRHSWTHTKVKTFECNECKKSFLRRDHLSKHVKTHTRKHLIINERKISLDEDSSDDGSDTNSNFDFIDSSPILTVPNSSDVSMKQETATEADTDLDNRFREDHWYEMEKIKVEPEKITEPSLPAFYPPSLSDHLKQKKSEEFGSSNCSADAIDFESNNTLLSSHPQKNFEVSVKQEIDTDAEESEYHHRFKKGDQYNCKDTTHETKIIATPDLNSSDEPTSMSTAIDRLVFPIAKKTHTSESNSTEKLHKCAVEGCDKTFRYPYRLKRHSWTHTKEKTLQCDKCEIIFLRKDHLTKHMKTHSRIPHIKSSTVVTLKQKSNNQTRADIIEMKKQTSSEEISGDIDFIVFSSNSLVPTNSDVPVKQETGTDTETDLENRFEEDQRYEMEEIKFEPEKITIPSLPTFYSHGLRHLKEKKVEEVGGGSTFNVNDFESNDNSPSSHFPIKFESHVKQEVDTD